MGGRKKPNYTALSNQGTMLQNYGGQFLGDYLSGTLTPAQQASVDVAQNRGDTAVRTAYSNAGIGPGSTMEAQDVANVGLQAEAIKGQFLDQYLQAANAMFATSSSDFQNILNNQTQYDQSSTDTMGELLGALGKALSGPSIPGMGGGGGGGGGGAGAAGGALSGAGDYIGSLFSEGFSAISSLF